MTFTIREATLEDVNEIAKVHVSSWHSTYTGMTDEQFANILTYESSHTRFVEKLEEDNVFIYVAEHSKHGIVGFVTTGPQRYEVEGYPGEVYAIYLLEEFQGTGVGKKLFIRAVQQLEVLGFPSFTVLLMKENTPAKRFYDHLGGKEIKQSTFEINEVVYEDIFYGWDNIHSFLETVK
ncbi:N-acetyltransferase family protein [Alkalihalobacillus sp. 1P02AB]|uniref:GNAT family N-acetyltransferase n=1 Tax=Alkalihalobacillus sp. 1P02AB TaxID=3132260 RepID=UPI0039A6C6EF